MASETLEFRGIDLTQLGMYLEELGALKLTETFPFLYKGLGWSAEILSEKTISFTPNFKVNSVLIRFIADDSDILQQVIKNYRFKTIRIGG